MNIIIILIEDFISATCLILDKITSFCPEIFVYKSKFNVTFKKSLKPPLMVAFNCIDLLFCQCFALYCTAVKVFYCFKRCKAFNTCRHWNFGPYNFFGVSEISFLRILYEIGML